jgi:hypothetical protein
MIEIYSHFDFNLQLVLSMKKTYFTDKKKNKNDHFFYLDVLCVHFVTWC